MSQNKHSWYRVPAWDGDKRQWKRYLRDVEFYLETEKLDVELLSRSSTAVPSDMLSKKVR